METLRGEGGKSSLVCSEDELIDMSSWLVEGLMLVAAESHSLIFWLGLGILAIPLFALTLLIIVASLTSLSLCRCLDDGYSYLLLGLCSSLLCGQPFRFSPKAKKPQTTCMYSVAELSCRITTSFLIVHSDGIVISGDT